MTNGIIINKKISAEELIEYESNRAAIDASSVCQLKCPRCPTGTGKNRERAVGWGFLRFSDFRNFIDDNPMISEIELAAWGEIFLNPEISEIIEYGHNKDVRLTARIGSNFNNVSDKAMESLVKHRFRELMIAIDGASDETYTKYRRGGSYEKVIRNIKKLNRIKGLYNSEFPKLVWQFIIFGHNEHEIEKARAEAAKLGMEFRVKLNVDSGFSPIKNPDRVIKATGLNAVTREEYRKVNHRNYQAPCYQLWAQPRINWDGSLLGCCRNTRSSMGNVFKSGFNKVLKGKIYAQTKKALLGLAELSQDLPCYGCDRYEAGEEHYLIEELNKFASLTNEKDKIRKQLQ